MPDTPDTCGRKPNPQTISYVADSKISGYVWTGGLNVLFEKEVFLNASQSKTDTTKSKQKYPHSI